MNRKTLWNVMKYKDFSALNKEGVTNGQHSVILFSSGNSKDKDARFGPYLNATQLPLALIPRDDGRGSGPGRFAGDVVPAVGDQGQLLGQYPHCQWSHCVKEQERRKDRHNTRKWCTRCVMYWSKSCGLYLTSFIIRHFEFLPTIYDGHSIFHQNLIFMQQVKKMSAIKTLIFHYIKDYCLWCDKV